MQSKIKVEKLKKDSGNGKTMVSMKAPGYPVQANV